MADRADPGEVVGGEGERHRRGPVPLRRRRGVGCPARVVAHGPRHLDRPEHVGAQVLHGLQRPDRHAELVTLVRVRHGQVERGLRCTDAVDDRAGGQPVERRAHGVGRLGADPAGRAGVEDHGRLGVRPVDRRGRDHRGVAALDGEDAEAGPVGGDDQQHVRARPAVDVHLRAGHAPRVVVAGGPGGGLAPGDPACRLVERDGTARLPGGEGGQSRVGPPAVQRVDEADRADGGRQVGGGAGGPAQLLEDDGRVDEPAARATALGRREEPDDAEFDEAAPHLVGDAALGPVPGAHLAPRCPRREEAPHGFAERLLFSRELEVHVPSRDHPRSGRGRPGR